MPNDPHRVDAYGADRSLLDTGTRIGFVFDWSLAGTVGAPHHPGRRTDPDNVADGIKVNPRGVDVSSGVGC
jgi:phosphoribosylanthranilate isomerase